MFRRSSAFLLLGTACLLGLTACGMSDVSQDAPSIYNKAETAPPPPGMKPVDAAWSQPAKTAQALPAQAFMGPPAPPPPVAASAPVPAVESSDTASMAAMNKRIDSLEKQISDMRSDMSMMMPALTKLVNAQQDLQQVLNRLDTASGNASGPIADTQADKPAQPGMPGPTAPVAAQPHAPQLAEPMAQASPQPLIVNNAQATAAGMVAAATAMPAAIPAPQPSTAQSAQADHPSAYTISEIRFGEHRNMTRIVLDASGKVPYTYSLDATGTLMTIMLPQTAWKTDMQSSPPGSLVESYTATPDGQGGSIVALRLKKPAAVNWSDILAPGSEGGYRVVMDMTPKA